MEPENQSIYPHSAVCTLHQYKGHLLKNDIGTLSLRGGGWVLQAIMTSKLNVVYTTSDSQSCLSCINYRSATKLLIMHLAV